jgi:hypothetical protein
METDNTSDPRQTFQRGDLVRVAKDLGGDNMRHFENDCSAVVVASYADLYNPAAPKGARGRKEYQLLMPSGYRVAWYLEHQLTLIEKNRLDLLHTWTENTP